MVLHESSSTEDLSKEGDETGNERELDEFGEDGGKEDRIRWCEGPMTGDSTTPEGLTEREAYEDAREDAGEDANDNNANVQPCKARLVEISRSWALVSRSKVVLVR
jgi:hypothetical protein